MPNEPATPPSNKDEQRVVLGLLAFLLLLYIPFTGSYGLWDPWETHYGEVARQMVERNDWISLWWPGSPQDAATFWSKPVLTFWLMAVSMKIFGLGKPGVAYAAEMTVGWKAEWALRLPFLLLGVAGIWAVYHLVRSVCGKRPALFSALVLATSTQWALISRQAMTDMAFVGPMTVGVAFAALALLLPKEQVYAELQRREVRVLGRRISWPHDRVFYFFLGLYLVCGVPQLLADCLQIGPWNFLLFGRTYRTFGIFAMLPWVALYLFGLWWILTVRNRRAIYLLVCYVLGGVATLAKGPAGIAMPVLIIGAYLITTGRLTEFLGERRREPWFFEGLLPGPMQRLAYYDGGMEVLRGSLVFLAISAPWYAAMLVRHGMPFWMELIGDNYVRRAQGRHGDRGTFEYYLRQLGAGLFPWSGIVMAGLLSAGRWLREQVGTPRQALTALALVWFVVDFMVVALVNTKFHHYILPAVPPLAILAGLFLDELLSVVSRRVQLEQTVALSLVALPLTWLAGRDLANFPARIGWLFNYDYVNAPGTGRPWPLVSTYGQRYEYQGSVTIFAILAVLAAAVLAAGMYARRQRTGDEDHGREGALPWWMQGPLGIGIFVVLLVSAMLVAPSPEAVATWSSSKLPLTTVLPGWMRFGFLVPGAAAALWLIGLLRQGVLRKATLGAGPWLVPLSVLAIVWNCWVLDRFMVDISPHWSQKHTFAAYYKNRSGPQDVVVAWYMYWRGENFYTKNQIYDHRLDAAEKTVFLGDHHAEKLQAYLNAHRGKRIFFLLERHRLETLRGLLPPECRSSLQVVDESNNKVYMAVAQL